MKDCRLSEVAKICKSNNCDNCQFSCKDGCVFFEYIPSVWGNMISSESQIQHEVINVNRETIVAVLDELRDRPDILEYVVDKVKGLYEEV